MSTIQADPRGGARINTPSLPKHSVTAIKIAHSLRNTARMMRAPGSGWLGTSRIQLRWQRGFRLGVLVSLISVVVLPILTASFYLGLIASDQFATELRFAVRGETNSTIEVSTTPGFLGGLPPTQRIQDTLILYEYIRGRGIVEDLERTISLRKIYSNPIADYFSRFNPKDSIEDLVWYWRWRTVYVDYDMLSSNITVIVRAFTPEESLVVAKAIVELSEKLVNELSERSRRDALQLSKTWLRFAEENLEQKTKAIRDLRNTEGVLDATEEAEVLTKRLGELRYQLIRMEQEHAFLQGSMTADSPQMQVLVARMSNMKEQIRRVETEMTNSAAGNSALSSAMSRFERLKFEREIAERQYDAAAAAYERARLDLETKHLYVATFLQPVLAEEAIYPRRWLLWAIVIAISLALWGAGIGIATLVRNHIAI